MADATRNTVTFSPEQLQAVIAQAIAEHEKSRQAQTKTDTTDQMNALTIRAFKRAGYNEADIKPRENILTYSKWVEKGFKAKAGERSVAVKSLRLFHESQVEPISKTEQAEYLARRAAKTTDRLPKPSPAAEPVKPSVALAEKVKGKKQIATAQQPAA
jgi:hypothetical protein